MAVMSFEQLMTILYLLIGWSTITSVILIITRRDVKLGLKKWWLIKRNQQPLKLRYYGADLNVHERIVATRGKGDSISIDDKKGFFNSGSDGSTFFLDEKAIRRCDDGINEVNFSYKSLMPIIPETTKEELKVINQGVIKSLQQESSTENDDGDAVRAEPIEIDQLIQYTDPKRLNRLIEYIALSAKASALAESEDVLKYTKYAFYASLGAVGVGALIWYMLDADIIPKLQLINSAVNNIGSTVLNV